MSNIMKGMVTDSELTEPNVVVPGYGTIPLEQLKKHVKSLSADFNQYIQQDEFTKAAYYSEQFFNAVLALARALKKQEMSEDQAPMFTPEDKMVNQNDPNSDGWRVYEPEPAGLNETEQSELKRNALKIMYDTIMIPLRGSRLYPTTENDFLKIAAISLQDLFTKRYNNLSRQQIVPASQAMAKEMLEFYRKEFNIRGYRKVGSDSYVRESSIMQGLKKD
jgi:hypothetical protein